jgi:hypothetical protein
MTVTFVIARHYGSLSLMSALQLMCKIDSAEATDNVKRVLAAPTITDE